MKCTQDELYGQATFKNARVRPGLGGRGSGFLGVAPACARPDEFKACQGYLERPAITAKLEFKLVHIRWSLTPISVGML